jgi:phage gp29-like protein
MGIFSRLAAALIKPVPPPLLALPPPTEASGEITASFLPPSPPPAPSPAPAGPRIVIMTQASKTDYFDMGASSGLTPERLFRNFWAADNGYPQPMLDNFESLLLNDGHARGHWDKRLDSVALQDVQWQPPPRDKREETAKFAELFDEHMASINQAQALEHIALEPHNGWSYLEVAWQTMSNGLQLPAYLVPVPARRFVFDPVTFEPRLTSDDSPNGDPLRVTPYSSWVLAQSMRWRKPTQAGRLRTAAPWMVFKRMSVRDWLIFAEKFGIPMIIGKYAENSGEAARQALVRTIEILGTEGRAVLEDGQTVDVTSEQVRSGTNDHLHGGIVALCNAEISKIFTGATLTSDTGGPGSYALGAVHAAGEHRQTLADAQRIGLAMRQIAVEAVRRNNLAGKISPPQLYIEVQPDVEAMKLEAEVVKILGEAGLEMSKIRNRRRFNQPAPRDPEDTMIPLAKDKKEKDNGDKKTPADSKA